MVRIKNGALSIAISLLLLLLVSSSAAFGQGTALAQLNGSVHDQGGAVIQKAEITLRSVNTNLTYSASTNQEGYFNVPNLPPDTYELAVDFAGFTTYKQTGIVLSVAQVATIDVNMKVGSKEEKIEVTASAPVTEPTRTEISQVVETKQIQDLPVNGRLFTDFALLTPGVATGRTGLQSTFTDPTTTRISFGGQRDLQNQVTVDDADNINSATGSQRATPSQEAVSEFRVVNNSFGAEYGRALGGIVNIVTKSGTNTLHGSVYEYIENSELNARTILTLPQFNQMRQNQFGATLGGPIQKDKTFFFVNYEGQRRGQSPTYPLALVQNLTAINALKTSLGVPGENLNVLKTADSDQGFIKVDHQFNDSNRVSLRYSIEDATDLNMLVGETLDGGGIGAPSEGRNGLLRDQALVGSWTSVITPNLVNSVLVQWARRNYGFPSVTNQPNFDIPDFLSFGRNFGAFDRYNESRVQVSDSVSLAKGRHTAKFGFDSNDVMNYVYAPQFTPGRVIFASLPDMLVSGPADWNKTPCAPPLPSILLSPCPVVFMWGAALGTGPLNPATAQPSVPTTWQIPIQPSIANDYKIHVTHGYVGFFAQDQWRLTSKLTVNYGMRYDFETGLPLKIGTDFHEFQPRVGLAYSPSGKTVIRAGFGIFFDKVALTFPFLAMLQRPPVTLRFSGYPNQTSGRYTINEMNLGFTNGDVPPPVIDQAFENLLTAGSYPNNQPWLMGGQLSPQPGFRSPYSEQASLEIEREFGRGFSADIGYLFVGAHKLERLYDGNISNHVGVLPDGKFLYDGRPADPNTPLPFGLGTSGTNGLASVLDSTGNGSYNGMTVQVMERLNPYVQFNANYTYSKAMDDGSFVTFVNFAQSWEQRNLERAISNQDVTHRFVSNFTFTAPQHSFARNFELSGIVTLESGRPLTLFVGFDANNDTNPVNDRVGLSRRNTYRGDPLQTVDLRISRTIHFKQERQLSLALDAFNLLNKPNVNEVFTVYGAPDFIGPIPQHYKDGITSPANPTFGTPRTVFPARILQGSVKFRF